VSWPDILTLALGPDLELEIEREGEGPVTWAALTPDERATVILAVRDSRARAETLLAIEAVLVDYAEAARMLRISVAALRKRVSDGVLPARCIRRTGRRVQFVREALVKWAGGSR
jgi:hypothetical protein